MILGLVLALVGGGGGFMAVQMGLIGGSADAEHAEMDHAEEGDEEMMPLVAASFVPLDTIVVNLPNHSGHEILRFTAQLEVAPAHQAEVEAIKPRIVDVLNSYLRAVDVVDLEDPTALVRLRSQMLRRVQVVTGVGRVTDLLIQEFVLY
jgi:flagellar FliL protein